MAKIPSGTFSRGAGRAERGAARVEAKAAKKSSGGLRNAAIAAALGMLGGGRKEVQLGNGPTTSGGGGGKRGGGEANYNPLPSFPTPTAQVKKYSKPTIAIISNQVAEISANMRVTQKLLENQFKQSAAAYREMARVQREKNMESGGPGGSVNAVSLARPMGNGSGGGFPGMLPGFPGGPSRNVPDIPDAKAVKKPGLGQKISSTLSNKAAELEERAMQAKTSMGAWYNNFKKGAVNTARKGVIAVRKSSRAVMSKLSGWSDELINYFGSTISRAVEMGQRAGGQVTKVIDIIIKNKAFQKFLSIAKKAFKGAKSLVTKPWILNLAFALWDAWGYIKEMGAVVKNRKNLTKNQMTSQLTEIASSMVADVGIDMAVIILTSMIGSAVATLVAPGLGTFVGAVIGFMVGAGIAMIVDFLIFLMDGKSWVKQGIEPLVKKLVEGIYGATEGVNNVTGGGVEKIYGALGGGTNAKTGEAGTVAASKPKASATKSGITVREIIMDAAKKAGSDPAALLALAKGDLNKDISSVTGKEVFGLTTEQWKEIMGRYGSKFPQLSAGINDPKAASLASALLLKDSKDFLVANKLPLNPAALQATWLFGANSTKRLLESDPNRDASKILPAAAQIRPDLFKDPNGKSRTVSDLLSALYQTQARGTSTGGAGTVPVAKPAPSSSAPTPLPAATNPASPAASSQPPAPVANPSSASDSSSSGSGSASSGSSSAPSTGVTAISPSVGPSGSNLSQDSDTDTAKRVMAESAAPPGPNPTAGGTTEVKSASQMYGDRLKGMMKTIEDIFNPPKPPKANPPKSVKRAPVIVPSGKPGRAGTGLVPDPYFYDLEGIEPFIFMKSKSAKK